MVDRSQTPALGYMKIVPSRMADTLLPIIQAHIHPGTLIHSDQWSAYQQGQSRPNVSSYDTVNHSVEFANSATGTHTQNVELYWNCSKRRFKAMKGCHVNMLPSYLDNFLWQEWHGKTASDPFMHIMANIADQYPV